MKRKTIARKCYRCDSDGVTKEHAPADSFFPKGHRENLVTVPSCPDHNTANSKDVEYVRNIITCHIDTNEVARFHLQNKVTRSFQNSPNLFAQTFKDTASILFNGEEAETYRYDFQRFSKVVSDLAYALYYKDFGKTFTGAWGVFSLGLLSSATVFESKPDGWDKYRNMLLQLDFTEMPTPQPKVFRYGIVKWTDLQLIYRFVFYEGFVVDALSQQSETVLSTLKGLSDDR